jgi:hypothetical protein
MNSKQDETLLTIQEVAQIWDIPVSLIANIGSEANESKGGQLIGFINSLRAYLNGTYLNGKTQYPMPPQREVS